MAAMQATYFAADAVDNCTYWRDTIGKREIRSKIGITLNYFRS